MQNNFYAMLSRMKYIDRWALMRNTRKENLCEHSFEVAYIVHALAVIAEKRLGKKIDAGRAVLAALYHDTTEIITGDMPTPVKYYNPVIKTAYKEVESAAADMLISNLPEDIQAEYSALIRGIDGEIATLVKAADKISALIKCTEELKMGNREFTEAKASTERAIKALNCPEADIFVKEFIPAYTLTLDEQSK